MRDGQPRPLPPNDRLPDEDVVAAPQSRSFAYPERLRCSLLSVEPDQIEVFAESKAIVPIHIAGQWT